MNRNGKKNKNYAELIKEFIKTIRRLPYVQWQ